MNYSEFSTALRAIARIKPDRHAATALLEFCQAKFGDDQIPAQLGLWEFSEFVGMLSASKTEMQAYSFSTASRRFCRIIESGGVRFKTSPQNWKTPPKPDRESFDSLSREDYEKLCDYLSIVIDRMRDRIRLVTEAESHTFEGELSGEVFARSERSFAKYQVTLVDAVSVLLEAFPDFPIECGMEDLLDHGEYGINRSTVDYAGMTNALKVLRKRFTMQRMKYFLPALSDGPDLSFQDVADILLPSEEEAAAIRKAICLETGWSPDLVANIDPHGFAFQEIDPTSDVVCIKTFKEKGTQRGEAYTEAKLMVALSSKSKPDSAYNLINLWLKRTKMLRKTQLFGKMVDDHGFEPFFVVASQITNLTKNNAGRLRFLHPKAEKGRNNAALNRIYKKTLGITLDERQLRPTHLYFRLKDHGVPFALMVTLFGHSYSSITDEVYRSGKAFEQDRKDRLSAALNEIEESISDGSFAGQLIPLREQKTMKDKVFTVFSDHSNENPIAVCSDPFNPSWPGHDRRVSSGKRCKVFSKCLLCSKSRVFSNNLPFVVDRYLYLEKLSRSLREDQFSIHNDEYRAAKHVVEMWPYQEDVEDAKERTFLEGHILPPVLMGDTL